MAKTNRLTPAQWKKAKAPFYWLRIENKKWGSVEREMICKWLECHIGGWFYYDGHETYVFERNGDSAMFLLWVQDDPFASGSGEIDLGQVL